MSSFSSPYQRHKNDEGVCVVYNADRHAAAVLTGLGDCANNDKHGKVGAAPFSFYSEGDIAIKSVNKKRNYRKRKATHTVRKEEKLALEQEIEILQKDLELLKMKVIIENDGKTQSDRKRLAKTIVLREAVQEKHLVLARAHAMLAGHSQQWIYRVHPTEITIRLGNDRGERLRTLSALGKPKLEIARRYLMERARGLSSTSPYFQEERYTTINGDYCVERFDVIPFRGARLSVQEVFAALQQATVNAEIIVSELSGNITIRDDDELENEHFSHKRFVSHMSQGVQIESNLVLFSDLQEGGHDCDENKCYAIMASEFVDDDAKYPYRPNERIRRDLTTVTMVTSCRETSVNGMNPNTIEFVVVVKRWALTIVRQPAMFVPDLVWNEIRYDQVRWADLMFNCVRQTLGLPVEQ
ncbi:uncharacterized protein PHALS_12799 [Plasmopara halstedii]|uniref:Uncharacterized protein n=1 Tax=Plasmopara halstedii TaxID=4781 RepID=A0A0P1AP10_PLAHL|nr:uncharacterized protein PHALS_12799 [Plasmopara halstedii]CEG42532.1 hypothetical protein PHALS_12799 [Plasmopara halstedii]|eukprot:XP_024578901.1 hypothetical protein PHALS_12799 [Plasmopara halstedii]